MHTVSFPGLDEPGVGRLAVLSLHTSPLAQPGVGDGGGMNVYVAELTSALASSGVDCTVFTRRTGAGEPSRVHVEPGYDVVHVDAGPTDLDKHDLPAVLDRFTAAVREHPDIAGADAIHANYWLSGEVGHRLKHELGIPLAVSFHTLGSVKSRGGDPEPLERIVGEARIIECADVIVANALPEYQQLTELYEAPPGRVEIIHPGVDHALFGPGDRTGARWAVGLDGEGPVLLFVGRIQPLKGVDIAVATLAALQRPDARLVVLGGPSGPEGVRHLADVRALASRLGVADRIMWEPPTARHLLSSWYRAADVVVVPSRSESFGLVALEAAACGIPVVASAVGGLTTVVVDGRTGVLVPSRDPGEFASAAASLLDDPMQAERMGLHAAFHAQEFTWEAAAEQFADVVAGLRMRQLVECR